MRSFYLHCGLEHADLGGCRGGIGDNYPDSQDYGLEIGQQCNADVDLLAVAVMHDEIIELLGNSGPLGQLVLRQYNEIKAQLCNQLTASKERARKFDSPPDE